MDYSKMILIEHLVNTIINRNIEQKLDLVFRIDNNLYTGKFLLYDERDQELTFTYDAWGYNKDYRVFNNDNISTTQEIRSSFFEFAFGPEKNSGILGNYISHPDMVLRNIISFVEQYDLDFLNPIVRDTKCIYNLKNINTGVTFDFYLLSDENILPVSLIKQVNE